MEFDIWLFTTIRYRLFEHRMLPTSVNSKTIMTFGMLVIALASLFASGSILTNQQALGAGEEVEQPAEAALPAAEVAKAVMPAL